MPLPTTSDLHVNELLTGMLVGFLQKETKFVAPRVFPVVPVVKQSNNYPILDRGDFLRDEAKKKAPGAKGNRLGYRVDTSNSYNCEVWSADKDVPDENRENADPVLSDLDGVAARYLNQKRMIREEVDWNTNHFTTGKWTGSSTATDLVAGTDFTAWDDISSDIFTIIDTEREAIESATGYLPNKLVVSRSGWNQGLKSHPDIVDRHKHTSPESITPEIVARLLELDEILVAGAVRNTADEGATVSASYIHGKHALLCYAAPAPAIEEPSAGYTFRWTGLEGSEGGATVSTFRDDDAEADIHRIKFAFDHKVISGVLGAFFQNVVS